LTLLAALAAIVIVGVGFRKAGAALVWYDEIASVLLAWLTYYGASLAALRQAHIGFPKIVQSLPARARLALALLKEFVVVTFFIVIAWAGLEVLAILDGIYLTSLPSVSARVTQSVMPISACLFVVAELSAFAEQWPRLREAVRTADEEPGW
jgi:TRAP-type C4-dicarboxylate transport system permease small subunit